MSPSRAFLRAVACCSVTLSCLLVPAAAAAQGGLTLRARGLAGYTHERPEVLGSEHDLWSSAIPEMSYLVLEPRWMLRATYSFTTTVHTRNPNQIAQRFALASSYEVSRRTQLLLNAEANQSTISNYLLTGPAGSTPTVTALPLANTNIFTATAGQGIAWEASPVLLFGQHADGAFVTSLDDDVSLTSVFANVGVSLERLWKNDAVGGDLRGGFARTDAAPLPVTTFYSITAAPRWRHDWTESVSHSLSGGATLVLSPDGQSDPFVAPYGRASVLYTEDLTSAELAYAGGVAPNLLSGQLLRSHQVTLRGTTPLSQHHRVTLSGSVGYLRGQILVLDDRITQPPAFDAFLSDADISWLATDHLSLFGRYQFFGQFGGPGNSFLREAIIFGVQIASRPPDGVRIPTQFAQRVDRSEAAPRR